MLLVRFRVRWISFIDGFKRLVFSVAIEPEERVEILVALRYEKLYGFCKECLSLTHDQSRCPRLFQEETVSSTKREPVTDGTEGANATSYKAVVANGTRQRDERGPGQQSRYQGFRGGDKGQGIARDNQGPFRQEDSYHPYGGKFSRGYGEGSTFQGRHTGYGGCAV